MKCSGCGRELDNDAAFCSQCGAKVGAAPGAPAVGSSARSGAEALTNPPPGNDEPEEPLWEGGYSARAMVGSWLGALLGTVLLVVGCVLVPVAVPVFLGGVVLLWLTLTGVFAYRRLSIHYELTSQRFNHQSGILTRTSDRIEMIDIDDVTFTQSIIERLFNVGTIKLSSSDRTHPEFKLIGVADVRHVANLIDDARRKERRRRSVHIESI